MTQLIQADGFVGDDWPRDASTLPFDAVWEGQDLPLEAAVSVDLPVTANAEDVVPWFDKIGLIRVPFGSFSDGRGFSLARRLRALGYAGRLRAEGDLLPDQFRAALRVGFDEVAVSDAMATRNPEEVWLGLRQGAGYQTLTAA